MGNSYRWQAPGNGRIFDLKFEECFSDKRFYMSKRSIGVLKYINEKTIVFTHTFEEEIKNYLLKNFDCEENDSCTEHFYRPLLFVGLIRLYNNSLSLSIDGRNFLLNFDNGNYDEMYKSLILQLLKTRYPNIATKDVKLHLFPFRIMFKLIINNGNKIKRELFRTEIPYITDITDVAPNVLFMKNYESYAKWDAWVISSLISIGILSERDEFVSISDKYYDYIYTYISVMSYEEMFFNDNTTIENTLKNNIRKYTKRNSALIKLALEKYNYTCFCDNNHITFRTKNNIPNFVEGHHIIPVSLQDSFENVNLDDEDNIVPLCPNCHRLIHFAIFDQKEKLLRKFLSETKIKEKFNVDFNDLKEIYE